MQVRRTRIGEAMVDPFEMFFNGPLHMDVPELAEQREFIYISSVRTLGVV